MAGILLVDDDALTLSLLSQAAQILDHISIMTLSALHAVELESPRRIRLPVKIYSPAHSIRGN